MQAEINERPAAALATIPEAAAFLSVSRATVYSMMDSGDLPGIRLPGVRCRRVRWDDLKRIAASAVGAAE